VGTLTALRRTASGAFGEAEALALPATRDVLAERLLPLPDAARRALAPVALTEAGVVAARFGRRVPLEDFVDVAPPGEPCAWFDGAGALVAVGMVDRHGRVLRGFG
jgi:tRNA U55 pseudouridine synthase TruB